MLRHVRLVAWNCCSGGARKWDWIEQLDADVAVVCEGPRNSPRPTPTLLEPAVVWHAAGNLDHKQVAIGSSRFELEALEAREGQGQWAVATHLAGGPDILGIWSCPPNPNRSSYASSVTDTLAAWADVLADGQMLVAGDFNVGFPVARDGQTRHAKHVVRTWEALGLVSVYHTFFDVAMGQESRPTFFDERRRQLGWHIDYILIPMQQLHRIRHVELGDYWEWVASGRSDHVPLIIDLDW
jgi:hypothetical protein